jgi:hypothetical protein
MMEGALNLGLTGSPEPDLADDLAEREGVSPVAPEDFPAATEPGDPSLAGDSFWTAAWMKTHWSTTWSCMGQPRVSWTLAKKPWMCG